MGLWQLLFTGLLCLLMRLWQQLRFLAATLNLDEELSERWILDWGAEFHVACNLDSVEDFEPHQETLKLSSVFLGNGEVLSMGRGSLMTEKLRIPNVYYVLGIPFNVVSVSQLFRDHGLSSTFYHDRCYVRDRYSHIVGFGVFYEDKFVLHHLRIEQGCRSIGPSGFAREDGWGTAPNPYNRSFFYMDSGAGCHVTPYKDVLQAYLDYDNEMFPGHFPRQVVCADGKTLTVHGMGNIDTGAINLEDVLHVPGVVANLVSVRHLTKQLNERLRGQGEAAVTFYGSRFIVHTFAGGVETLQLGNGTAVGDDIYVLNELQRF